MRIEWDVDVVQLFQGFSSRAKMYLANIVLWFLIMGIFQWLYGSFSTSKMLETISVPVLITTAAIFGPGTVVVSLVCWRFARNGSLSGIRLAIISGFRRLLGEVASSIQNAASVALVIGLIYDRSSGLAWPGVIFLISAIGLEMTLSWYRMKDKKISEMMKRDTTYPAPNGKAPPMN